MARIWFAVMKKPLGAFSSGSKGVFEANQYFISKPKTLGPLFAFMACYEQLRPAGLEVEEALRLADPSVLKSLNELSKSS